MYKILPAGRFFLAVPMLVFPVFHYLYPTGVASILPPWIPWHLFWNYFTAITIQAAGLAFLLMIPNYTRLAAILLGVEISIFTLNLHTFLIFPIPGTTWGVGPGFGTFPGRLVNCFKEVGMIGACFIFAGSLSRSWPIARRSRLMTTGRIILGIAITAFGLIHFIYPVFGPGLPPMKENIGFPLPGHPFWVYLTGTALLVGGLCILTDTRVRQTATLLGIMILLFCMVTYLPWVPTHPEDLGGNWLKDLGIIGGIFILAKAYGLGSPATQGSLRAHRPLGYLNRLFFIPLLLIFCTGHTQSTFTYNNDHFVMPKMVFDAKGDLVITPSATSSNTDFDFFVGKWNLHNKKLRSRLTNSKDWDEFDFTVEDDNGLAGMGNFDIARATFDGKPWEGRTIRIFNPQTRLWSLYWMASDRGALDPPVVGSFENNVGLFFGKDMYKGRPIIMVFKWDKTDSEKPVWSQAFSDDNGKTWEWNWYNISTRIK